MITGYRADHVSSTDYYAFGATMTGRNWISSAGKYRYTHNGHEREDELFEGAQSAEYWMYDSRLGRRWEVDPITYPWQSPYATFNNNPIYFADPRGLKGEGGKDKPVKKGDHITKTDVANTDEITVTASKIDVPSTVITANGPASGQPLPQEPVEKQAPLPVLTENTIMIHSGSSECLSASNCNVSNRAYFVDLRPESYINFNDAYSYLNSGVGIKIKFGQLNTSINEGGVTYKKGAYGFKTSGDVLIDGRGVSSAIDVTNGTLKSGGYGQFNANSTGYGYGIYSWSSNTTVNSFMAVCKNQQGSTTGTLQVTATVIENSANALFGFFHNRVVMNAVFTSTNGTTNSQHLGTAQTKGVSIKFDTKLKFIKSSFTINSPIPFTD
jgi:RHS repeat-associated protein